MSAKAPMATTKRIFFKKKQKNIYIPHSIVDRNVGQSAYGDD